MARREQRRSDFDSDFHPRGQWPLEHSMEFGLFPMGNPVAWLYDSGFPEKGMSCRLWPVSSVMGTTSLLFTKDSHKILCLGRARQ